MNKQPTTAWRLLEAIGAFSPIVRAPKPDTNVYIRNDPRSGQGAMRRAEIKRAGGIRQWKRARSLPLRMARDAARAL